MFHLQVDQTRTPPADLDHTYGRRIDVRTLVYSPEPAHIYCPQAGGGELSADIRSPGTLLRLTCSFVLGLFFGVIAILVALMLREPLDESPLSEPGPGERDISIFIKEEYLADQITSQLQRLREQSSGDQGPLLIENLRIDAQPDNLVEISGDAMISARIRVPFRASVRPFADNGRLHVTIVSTKLGRLPLPVGLTNLDDELINEQLDRILGNLPATLLNVHTEETGITLDLKLDPDIFTPTQDE